MIHAWDKQPNESPQAFRAFSYYRDAGPTRSLEAVGEALYPPRSGAREGRVRGVTGRIRAWASDHAWKARAAGFDEHLDRLKLTEAEDAERAAAERWVARREEHRQTMWALAEEAKARLEVMLRWPLSESRVENRDGQSVTIISPARWNYSSLSRLMAETDRVARLALDPTAEQPKVITISNPELAELAREYGVSPSQVASEIEAIARRLAGG